MYLPYLFIIEFLFSVVKLFYGVFAYTGQVTEDYKASS